MSPPRRARHRSAVYAAALLVPIFATVGHAQVESPAPSMSPTATPNDHTHAGPDRSESPESSADPTSSPRPNEPAATDNPTPTRRTATEERRSEPTTPEPVAMTAPTDPPAPAGEDPDADVEAGAAATTPGPVPDGESGDRSAAASPTAAPEPRRIAEPLLERSPRTGPRNTVRLVELLRPLTDLGMPLKEVLVEGMGRFPVAGVARYSDDWLHPRYTPTLHLHKGVDIFAAFGTPIRAPSDGEITRFSNNPSGGGVAVWMLADDGDQFYFAHLRERAAGLRVGQRVRVGDVIGSVGDSGNARGASPHLHFEVHRGTAVPPKPIVDAWLHEAEERAPAWVERRMQAFGEPEAAAVPAPAVPIVSPIESCTSPGACSAERRPAEAGSDSGTAADTLAEARVDAISAASFETSFRSPAQFLVTLGLLIVLAAVSWRAWAMWWASRRLRRALADPDPILRQSAVEVATAQGLARHATALAQLVRREQSMDVLQAIAEAVARNLWEPGDNRGVIELRLWADRWRREIARVPSANGARQARAIPADDGTGRVRVLVTGAGGPAGVAVIRALSGHHHVVAADADPLASGLRLADAQSIVPPASDPDFVASLLEVVQRHGVRALISTITEEMLVLSDHEEDLAPHVGMWLASRSSLEACRDKWQFASVMREAGISTPPTALGGAERIPGPWIVKPRFARGSRGVHHVDSADELQMVVRRVDDPIVQTRLQGREFTVDALVSRSGELVAAVPRWRLETKAGISTKGRTFSDETVIEGVASVLSALRLEGAANVQGFVDGSTVTFLEVNPRFSGGLPLSLAAGADLVGEYLRGVLSLPVRCDRLTFRDDTTMTRHFEEIYA